VFRKLDEILDRYSELEKKAADPALIAMQEKWREVVKEMGELEESRSKYLEYKKTKSMFDEVGDMLRVGGLSAADKEMFAGEKAALEKALAETEAELKTMLTPKDPNDDKNVILEIRAGTGGEEAALFAGDLLRMYTRYAERDRYKLAILDVSESAPGRIKEAVLTLSGKGAYSKLKYESGVHRVQRIPETESQGRIHTSAATIAVLPEVDDVEVVIDPADVRVDVYHSSGHGGQSVNTTDSAVRLTHEPTGIIVTCQDEKSQIKNKDKAFKVLRSRLYEKQLEEQERERSDARRSMVGTGDRSQRIRTYNFPQNRVTDHRIGLTLYKLDSFMDGELDEMIDALAIKDSEIRASDD
jgi:peptide chain release factor 1